MMPSQPEPTRAERLQWGAMLALLCGVWCINASFNFHLGKLIGSDAVGWTFVAVALLGAYAASAQATATGARRALFLGLVAMQLVLGQLSGWQAMGVTLERGASRIADGAEARNTLLASIAAGKAEIGQIRARRYGERKTDGLRPVEAIEPLEARECKLAPRGRDPVGARCTALREELGAARRLRDLEATVRRDVAKLDSGATSKIGKAEAGSDVPVTLANAVLGLVSTAKAGPDDVRFFLNVFVVFVLEAIATLGFWLFGVDLGGPTPRRRPASLSAAASEPADLFPNTADRLGIAGLLPAPYRYPSLPGNPPAHAAARAAQAPSAPGSDGPHHMTAAPSMHGAPINIHVSSPASMPMAASPAGPAGEVLPPAATSPARPGERSRQPRHDVGRTRDARPVDRAPVVALMDRLAGFRAARVVDAVGSLVETSDMYASFRSWCGPGACGEAAFHELFPAASGLDLIEADGRHWYRGAALREAALAAVG